MFDDYTTKPMKEQMFTITKISRMTGASPNTIRAIAEKANIESYISKDKRVLLYNYSSMRQIVGIITNTIKIKEVKKANKKEPLSIEQMRAEHPLVKDDRFFKLSYFPDITPKCFAEI